jgi:hypothetical protein
MFDLLNSANPLAGLTITVLALVILGLASYLLGRRLLASRVDDHVRSLANHLHRTVAVLLGLLLSLTFSAVRSENAKIQSSVELETAQIGDLFQDLQRFGGEDAEALEIELFQYVQVLIDDEWPSLAQGMPSRSAWQAFRDLETGIVELTPAGADEVSLKSRMLEDLDEISDHRRVRESSGDVAMVWFLTIVLIGFAVSAFLMLSYDVTPVSLTLIAMYSAFIGAVLYSILALHSPFQGLTAVTAEPFLNLMRELTVH